MSNIYLAARYSRYPEMQTSAIELMRAGHIITSRWIWGSHQISDEALEDQAHEAQRCQFAIEDLTDLECANCLISFTEVPRASTSRGGRHTEFGYALHSRREHDRTKGSYMMRAGRYYRLIVIGHRENVFHCVPEVEFYSSWDAFKAVSPTLCQ